MVFHWFSFICDLKDFHEMSHGLLLWLENIDRRRNEVVPIDPIQDSDTLHEHHKTLTVPVYLWRYIRISLKKCSVAKFMAVNPHSKSAKSCWTPSSKSLHYRTCPCSCWSTHRAATAWRPKRKFTLLATASNCCWKKSPEICESWPRSWTSPAVSRSAVNVNYVNNECLLLLPKQMFCVLLGQDLSSWSSADDLDTSGSLSPVSGRSTPSRRRSVTHSNTLTHTYLLALPALLKSRCWVTPSHSNLCPKCPVGCHV